jgi:Gas vesicle synthesis protein GvpL/GvpF
MRPRPAPAYRLFGLVAAREPIALAAHLHARLETFQELAAVVAEQPSAGSPPPAAVEAHREIVASVFAHSTILPAPPGIVFRSLAVLHRWLELHHAALLDGLAYIEGRAEARVHIRRAPVNALEHAAPAPVLAPVAAPVANRDRDAAALDCVAAEIFYELGREQPAWVGSPSVPGAGSRTRDDGDVSASFLVDRSRWRAFVDAVVIQRQRAPELDIRLTGPWPPYDFVRLQFGG